MHPYVIDRMVQERQDELLRLGRADRGVRAARKSQARARAGTTIRLPLTFAALAERLGRRAGSRRVLEPCPRAPVRPC